MKILFCFDSSAKSVYFESLTEGFLEKGIEVEALFFCEKGILQERLERQGIVCHNYIKTQGNILFKAFFNVRYVVKLVKSKEINGIFSHLVYANFYAALASYFLPKTKVVVCRHHADQFYQDRNNKAIRFDKIINFLAPHLLVISQKGYEHVTKIENVPAHKVSFLPLVYDFEKYNTYEKQDVEPKKSDIALRVIAVSRLVFIKRIAHFFPVIQHFKEKNSLIEMYIIGDGPLGNELKKQVKDLGIADLVHFLGHQENVIPHIEAADLMLQLSVSESSNQVVKEAGLCGKTVIACKGVGDFDEYLDETNAYLLERDFQTKDLIYIMERLIESSNTVRRDSYGEGRYVKGENLKRRVTEHFSFNNNHIKQYLSLFE